MEFKLEMEQKFLDFSERFNKKLLYIFFCPIMISSRQFGPKGTALRLFLYGGSGSSFKNKAPHSVLLKDCKIEIERDQFELEIDINIKIYNQFGQQICLQALPNLLHNQIIRKSLHVNHFLNFLELVFFYFVLVFPS